MYTIRWLDFKTLFAHNILPMGQRFRGFVGGQASDGAIDSGFPGGGFRPLPNARAMTLQPYDAEKLDRLALRFLDISAELRRIGRIAADAPGVALALHDRKALEWIAELEQWIAECAARADLAALVQKGANNARNIAQTIERKSPKRPAR